MTPTTPLETRDRRARRLRVAILLLVVYGAALLVVGLHVRAYPQLSPLDELQHFDYMVKASRGDLVRRLERVGQTAMREAACRGVDAGPRARPCDRKRFDPEDFQERGFNTASSQLPVYYAVTGLVARGLVAVGVTDSLLTGGRLAGFLWLGTGMLVVLALLVELKVPRASRVVATLLLLSAPLVLHASATVNPDGALLAGGGTVLLATLRWERNALHWRLLALTVFIAFTVDPATSLAVLLAVLYLGARAFQRRVGTDEQARPVREALVASTAMIGAMAVVYVSWSVVRDAIALDVGPVVLPRDTLRSAPELSIGFLARQVPVLVTPLGKGYLPPFLRTHYATLFLTATGWLAIGASFGGALLERVGSRMAALAVAAATVMLMGGPLWVLYRLPAETFFPIQARYGLSLVPALLLLVAGALRKRPAIAVVSAYAVVVLAYTLGLLVRG